MAGGRRFEPIGVEDRSMTSILLLGATGLIGGESLQIALNHDIVEARKIVDGE